VTDRSELEAVAKEILAASPEEARRYRAGEARLLEFFVGQLMRRTRGKASPAVAREVLIRLLGG
jgi:aspartyl-tRNA(Asn)/glutamyl-tRNA(Gln) amidotransferase subunit B